MIKKTDAKRPSDKPIQRAVYYTDEEWEMTKQCAKKLGMPVATFIRMLTLERVNKQHDEREAKG